MPPSITHERTNDILNTARFILDTGGDLINLCPIPGLHVAASTLSSLIGAVLVRGNEETRRDLAKNLQTLASIIIETMKQANEAIKDNEGSEWKMDNKLDHRFITSPELEKRVDVLIRNLSDLTNEASELKKGSYLVKFINNASYTGRLARLKQSIAEATQNFSIQGQLTIEMLLNGVVQELHRAKSSHHENFAEKALESLPYVNARYTSSLNPTTSGVLPGTRTSILEEITKWTQGPDSNGHDPLIYVLSGCVGTGKSTLAVEMAKRLDDSNSLGASFFFVRDVEKLNTTRHVLATIAYQLARSQQELYPHIAGAASTYIKQGKHGQQLEYDLEDLIIAPLKNVSPSHRRLIVVIDAPDECIESAQEEVVRLLCLFMQRLPEIPFPFRILVTTRPELHIQDTLDSVDFRNVSKSFKLHNIQIGIVDADIALFLRTKLSAITCCEEIFEVYPSVIEDLTKHAAGLFIYAATVINFLKRDTDHAIEIIDALLSDDPSDAAFSLRQLDKLYLTVLQNAFSEDDLRRPRIKEMIQTVLGSLALLQDHVSALVLEELVGSTIRDTRYTLRRLGSVIMIPDSDNDGIRMLHASFPQFLMDKTRCDNDTFSIHPKVHHTRLAAVCLNSMTRKSALTENICKLEDPLVFKAHISDLGNRVKKHIPAHLRYACINWATHLSHSDAYPDLLDSIVHFATTRLLTWLEILSYMGRLEVAVPSLLAARTWCQHNAKGTLSSDVPDLLYDVYRLILEFFLPISLCPEHLYISALPLAPSCKLTEIYADINTLHPDSIMVKRMTPRRSKWGSCLRVIETHTQRVFCAKFSPNGRWIASGSSEHIVQLWDAGIGMLKQTFIGHEDDVVSLAWSPNGHQIISGSRDSTFRVWNVGSGTQVYVQRVQSERCTVYGIAWNPDGTHIVSGSTPGGLQVWNLASGEEVKMGRAVPALTRAMAISTDAKRAAAISEDRDVQLWEIESDSCTVVKVLTGHTGRVNAVVFLHNNTQVASCSNDKTIRVWDVESGNCIVVVDALSVGATCLAVSSKGDLVASASSWDRNIRLWNSRTWEPHGVLTHHTKTLNSVSFSPDGERLVSSSSDSTIQLWDLSLHNSKKPQTTHDTSNSTIRHGSTITAVIYSADGSRIAAVSTDETISIWSPHSGKRLCLLKGNLVCSVAFSPNARELAVVGNFDDSTPAMQSEISIYNIEAPTPVLLRTFYGAARGIGGVAWSPDGLWITARACDRDFFRVLGVWHADTGVLVKELDLGSPLAETNHLEFSKDSAMIYVKISLRKELIFRWKEGEVLDVNQHRWRTEIERREFREEDGWITRKRSGRKLCWVPGSRRGMSDRAVAEYGDYYAVGGGSGQFTIFHFAENSGRSSVSSHT